MNLPWLRATNQGLSLQVKVKPSSKQNAIFIDQTAGLQISLQARAQDGKANKMLVQYLAKELGLQQKQIEISRGASSRIKTLTIKIAADEQEKLMQVLLTLRR
ncbi:hypothetical protein BN59_00113 [Legionella massiliensis]|uniref:UPF0235 protein BN59_00113 n=1 Tax=Legionella massiliensis TaxID=1034943 RepID=A0A078KVS0_9GAMM|nr:DUF167 domain-containing protein [Legionella massiliensis]CDZ75854.1 hypothetical protein BN59_00113 [Legionella massiliensis]CEE11592.1 hypothetical protein BN1094_00113 [Legionella massiliensis]